MQPMRLSVLILFCGALSACVPAGPGQRGAEEPGPPPGFLGPESDEENGDPIGGEATVGG